MYQICYKIDKAVYNSEYGFAADKKILGWNIAQRRDNRIDNALFCTGMWHNLFNMGRF